MAVFLQFLQILHNFMQQVQQVFWRYIQLKGGHLLFRDSINMSKCLKKES